MALSSSYRRRFGFTLVELLVVIGIIALLISILLPALTKARRQSVTVQCLSNMRQIGQAMIMYAGDYGGMLPGPCTKGQKAYYDNSTTRSVYLATFLAHYMGLPLPSSKTLLNPCFLCPAFPYDPIQSETYVTLITQPYLPISQYYNPSAVPILPFGQSVTTGVPVATVPAKLSEIKESTTAVALREIDKKNSTTNTNSGLPSPTASWSSGWNVLGYPLHGMQGRYALRNELFFDGHAETVMSYP